jgi:HAD superfamily hydrolase (TIGR01509 family)
METPDGMVSIDTVFFDLHTTLVDQGDSQAWLTHAEQSLGRAPHPDAAARRAMVAYLDVIWERAHQRDPHARRDRSAAAHRALFDELMADAPYLDEPLVRALYSEVSSQWRAYADAVPVLAALRALGVRTVVLSNTGIDIHDVLRREGLSDHLDAVVQSYEIGAVKPEVEAYRAALATVGAQTERTLMVGDNPGPDAGGALLGIRTLILPRTRGPVHGLAVVLGMVTASRANA